MLRSNFICDDDSNNNVKQRENNMTEYKKLELLHSQLDELIEGNQLPIDELKILQSFVEDIREKYFDDNGNLTESEE